MVYTKNATWTSATAITIAKLNNMETEYDEAYSHLTTHNHDAVYPTKTEMNGIYWYGGNDGHGSGADADLLYHAGGNLHIGGFYGLGVPTGIIILWYGSVGSIPSGWHLCDGSDGTIDLRGKFVVGAGNTYNPATSGGSSTFTAAGTITINAHVLTTAEMGSHTHPYTDTTPVGGSYPNTSAPNPYNACGNLTTASRTTGSAGSGDGHTHSAGEGTAMTGNAVDSMPMYYALCFIQKV